MYGLKDAEVESLRNVFKKYNKIEKVVLYGSRAKGNYKPFSDVDITLFGDGLSRSDLNRLALEIDDLLMPYQFDISIFKSLKNKDLIEHIMRIGIVVYDSAA